MLIRAQEMARYVSDGVLDAGLTGRDWIARARAWPTPRARRSRACREPRLREAELRQGPLGAGRAGETRRSSTARGSRGRHASPPNWCASPRHYFARQGVTVNVEFSWGATEVKPPVLADAIVEATETGSTLRANRLRIVDTVMESTRRSSPTRRHGRRLEADQDRQHRPAAAGRDRRAGPRRPDAERARARTSTACSRCCPRCSGRPSRRSPTTTGSP